MKRFYCTVCQKFKRVRQMPANVTTPNAPKPEDRKGQCKWHAGAGYTRNTLHAKVGA
jgi:hypothetical protein